MKGFFNGALAAAGAVCGFLFGELNGILVALISVSVLDYITGVISAAVNKTLSSSAGFRGICKKLMLFTIVALANIMDTQVIGGSALRTAVIFVFIANEGLSIIENSAELGVPIPQKLKDVLAQIRDKGENDSKNK
ncbi:MAG: phage holin family protein [Oscillospiraceae bacterium]|nr:phage holin family protein [Oscillospiraceae bacterium]